MDRQTQQSRLAQAEEQVARSLEDITRQQDLIADLYREGYDIQHATEVLMTLLDTHRQHMLNRDRIFQETTEGRLKNARPR